MASSPTKPRDESSGSPDDDAGAFGAYSSPPCFMHELDRDFLGLAPDQEPLPCPLPQGAEAEWPAVRSWRKAMRSGLIERRLRIASADRTVWTARLAQALDPLLPRTSGAVIGCYWPFRGEFDARPLLTGLRDRGARLALPVVVANAQPLQFRAWTPDTRLIRGVWGIPVPDGDETVQPDVVIAPLVGFDPAGYRLGYGGGFYDRTIANLPVKPQVIGVGFALARLATIYPQTHDIPMDVIVTEDGVERRPA